MTARYTNKDLRALANDRGPFAADQMRQALRWAADVLDAADAAVGAERRRADALQAQITAIKGQTPDSAPSGAGG